MAKMAKSNHLTDQLFLILLSICLVICLLLSIPAAKDGEATYLNPGAPLDKRVNDLISRMSIEEKASQLFYGGSENQRLSIPWWGGWNQCLHGVWSNSPTTLFPVPIAMAATWDPDLIKQAASAISDEARALFYQRSFGPNGLHGLVYRAPVINISRDPRWGRIQECWGEDPHLTGTMATAFIRGLQGDHPRYLKVAATLKHFAVNNQEENRLSLTASVPEKILNEYYFPHWKECVEQGKPQSVMAAYNALNGTPCAVNKKLLEDVLKKDWHFDGFVVSDLGGIFHLVKGHKITEKMEEAAGRALNSGCDMDDEQYRDFLPQAFNQKLVDEKTINQALKRVLKVAFKLGVFDPPQMVPYSNISPDVLNCRKHNDLALSVAQESIVLLKNENAFLPLSKEKLKTLAVIGPAVDRKVFGNYFGKPSKYTSVREAFQKEFKNTLFSKGCGFTGEINPAELQDAVNNARTADVVVLFLGMDESLEREGIDRKDLGLPACQETLLQEIHKVNPRAVLVLANAGPLSVKWAKEKVPAIIETWYSGQEGSTAITATIFGKQNPGGKLPYTIYESHITLPPQDHYDIREGFTYMYLKSKPLYPFGHGLSYSEFKYDNLHLSKEKVSQKDTSAIQTRLCVTNAGTFAGDEVVQVYARAKNGPMKLIAFKREHLGANEKRQVNLSVALSKLNSYDVNKHAFVLEKGNYEILVGSSSEDIKLKTALSVF